MKGAAAVARILDGRCEGRSGSDPVEGIYYVVRNPSGWTLITDVFDASADNHHYEQWDQTVTKRVAAEWASALKKSAASIEGDIKLLTYVFPRDASRKWKTDLKIFN